MGISPRLHRLMKEKSLKYQIEQAWETRAKTIYRLVDILQERRDALAELKVAQLEYEIADQEHEDLIYEMHELTGEFDGLMDQVRNALGDAPPSD